MSISADDSAVFHRELDREYPSIIEGVGYWLTDDQGNKYLDAVGGGAAVVGLGYQVREIVEAIGTQSRILPFIHNQKFTNPLQEELATLLLKHAPRFSRSIFCQGGAEANETALRLARSFHVESGNSERWRFISVAEAYHGSTMATLSLTDRPALQHPYQPYLSNFLHIPPVNPETDPDGSKGLANLEELVLSVGPESVAAFFSEPVHAAAAPALRPPLSFFSGLEELARKYGFLVVFDEVVTGVGRTGTFLASDQLPVNPDIVTLAKGLGGGYVPFGAVLATERIYDAVATGSRDFSHGHTFNGYPLGCAVAIAILQYMDKHETLKNVQHLAPLFLTMLKEELSSQPLVYDIKGEGFLFGVTYRDQDDQFFDPNAKVARRVDVAALTERLLVYSTQPTADGYAGDQTMLAPALTYTENDFREVTQRLGRALDAVAKNIENGTPLSYVAG